MSDLICQKDHVKHCQNILTTFLGEKDLLTHMQHGFRPGRTQLLQRLDWVLKQQLKHSNVDEVYHDFTKALDKVYHGMICYRLHDLGMGQKSGCHSKRCCLWSDTNPQWGPPGNSAGSTIVYGCSLGHARNHRVGPHSLATPKIQKYRKAVNGPTDILRLQKDLNAIYKWADENNMAQNFKHSAINPQTNNSWSRRDQLAM